MITIVVHPKKGTPQTLNNVTKVRVGSKPISDEYSGDAILNCLFDSTKDITIYYEDGVYVVAKNTFESLKIC